MPTAALFNLIFEMEPVAAILIAHTTHGLSQKFFLGNSRNSRPKVESGKRFLVRGSKPQSLGEHCKLPPQGSGQSILDTLKSLQNANVV